jgi:hypothetical protein
MTTKERLHKLVDELSEAEAEATLEYAVSRHNDPILRQHGSIPLEDEEISEAEETAVQEARDELAAGAPTIPFEEIKRKYGYT